MDDIKEVFSSENFWEDFPVISCGIALICILIFVGVNLEPDPYSPESLFKWGAPSINQIRDGYFWGLFTNNLLNPHILFLFFTLSWLWTYGKLIEKRVGWFYYLWLIISSITFVSLFEIAFFDRNTYGSGGVTCALFGFIWIRSIFEPHKWNISPTLIAMSLLWILVCFIIATAGYLISYGGLIAGILWGSLFGFLPALKNRVLRYALPVLVLIVGFYPIFWSTGSISWLEREAHKYHQLADEYQNEEYLKQAKILYQNIHEQDPNNELVKQNLPRIITWEMGEEANKFFSEKKYDEAKKIYLEVLERESNNESAKKNLQQIHLLEMSEEAIKLRSQRKFNETRNICLEMLQIDSNDDWTKQCLDNLSQK